MTMHSDETVYVPGEWLLEELIATVGDHPDGDANVRQILRTRTTLRALGTPNPDGTTVNLLRCEVPVGGEVLSVLPVFTRTEYVDMALDMNSELRALRVLTIDGGVALAELEPGMWLAINLWSRGREFTLPPEGWPFDNAGQM
jgi:hypothetical protein